GEAGEADDGGDEDDERRPEERLAPDRIDGILERQRAAVRVSDEVQGRRAVDPPARLADRQPGRRRPVLPLDVGEGARNGAVRGQPDDDRDEATVAVRLRDVTLAVRRIRQAVQQNGRAY